MIKLVIFDMDGVLVDATEWHFHAFNEALAIYGLFITPEEHRTSFNGLPTAKKLMLLSEKRGLPQTLHAEINQLKQKITMDYIHRYCVPSQHHLAVLSQLKAKGYLLALCSNSIRATVELVLQKTELHSFFNLTLSNQDVKLAKPNPEIYLTAMKHFKVATNETVIVEDSEFGVQAAKASGAHCLIVKDVYDVTKENVFGFLDHLAQEVVVE